MVTGLSLSEKGFPPPLPSWQWGDVWGNGAGCSERDRALRVGAWAVTMTAAVTCLLTVSPAGSQEAQTAPVTLRFVENGHVIPELAMATGGELQERDKQTVIAGAETHLISLLGISEGDVHVRAELTIHGLDRSAAAFKLDHVNSFGFEGSHGKMYITGPLFDGARGKPIGDPASFIRDGEPFVFEAVREDGELRFVIDGKTAYTHRVGTKPLGAMALTGRRATMLVRTFTASGRFTAVEVVNMSPNGIQLHPKAAWLSTLKLGPHVRRPGGGILALEGRSVLLSKNDGVTWKPVWSFPDGESMAFSGERALIRTENDSYVCVFLNQALRVWGWDSETHKPIPKARSDVWSLRSTDGGNTWTDATMLYGESYSGCIRGLAQADKGNLAASVQGFRPELLRHATLPYVSTDAGKTWQRSGDVLDLPGKGHHDGVIEGTLLALRDGRLWNLLRTSYDELYSSYSEDGGESWSEVEPSGIDASDGPPVLDRLSDGRIILLWNRLYPEGKTSFVRKGGGERTLRQVSTHREELSMALSKDEGKTWTEPVVLARRKGSRVAYPYVFEHQPGQIWVTTMQGGLKIDLSIDDVVPEDAKTRPMNEWPW